MLEIVKLAPNPSELARHEQEVDEDQQTYIPCTHCDWLLLPGELHNCEPCGQLHTAESTWIEV